MTSVIREFVEMREMTSQSRPNCKYLVPRIIIYMLTVLIPPIPIPYATKVNEVFNVQ